MQMQNSDAKQARQQFWTRHLHFRRVTVVKCDIIRHARLLALHKPDVHVVFGPRFPHSDARHRAKIAIANARCRQSKVLRKWLASSLLTEDNAMFRPRFLHCYGRHRAEIAVRVATVHFAWAKLARVISLAIALSRARVHYNQIVIELFWSGWTA